MSVKETIFISIASILYVVCFPCNPLVLSGVLEVKSYLALFIIGWVVWAFGMALIMAPILMFPKRGGVPKGKSFVATTRLVNTGIYAVIRHPQYTGGIYAIFVTTLLWYPHWLFAILGVTGTILTYLSVREEDKRLIIKFGDDYRVYMNRVPGMNIFLGIIRLIRGKRRQS